jgi:hypothetical protein
MVGACECFSRHVYFQVTRHHVSRVVQYSAPGTTVRVEIAASLAIEIEICDFRRDSDRPDCLAPPT